MLKHFEKAALEAANGVSILNNGTLPATLDSRLSTHGIRAVRVRNSYPLNISGAAPEQMQESFRFGVECSSCVRQCNMRYSRSGAEADS